MLTPSSMPFDELVTTPRSTSSTSESPTIPECTPRSRRLPSMAMIASGIAPKPTCSVARSGMKESTCPAMRRSSSPIAALGSWIGWRSVSTRHVDVGVGQRDVARRLRHLPVHLGDDDARLVDGGARVVGAEAQAVAAVLVARRDLHERDVAADRAVGDELGVLRDVARHDIHRAGLDQAPVGADAAHPMQGDAVDGAGLERVGEHRAQEGANAAELATLAHERLGERQRLGRSLAHDDGVAGTDPVGEAKLRGVDADHVAAPACVRRRCSPNATMRWARFRSGPSIILPSKSIVPMPRAVASS